MEKTTRIVIETKGGFRFGYEKIVKEEVPEPKKELQLTYNKGALIDTSA